MVAVCFGDALRAGDKITVCKSGHVPGCWSLEKSPSFAMADTDTDSCRWWPWAERIFTDENKRSTET